MDLYEETYIVKECNFDREREGGRIKEKRV